MSKRTTKILILERDNNFSDRLRESCESLGKTWVTSSLKEASKLLNRHSFDLLLLEWELIRSDASAFWAALDHFQPEAGRIALFHATKLNDVVEAMKSGMHDVYWQGQNQDVLEEKLEEVLRREKTPQTVHSYVTQLAESLADRASVERMSLFKARREFTKIFLGQFLKNQKMKRFQLAKLMNITPRTLQRHLFE